MAAVTALCNFMNSGAARAGAYAAWEHMPADLPGWLVAVAVGNALGAYLGSRSLTDRGLCMILAIVLPVPGIKAICEAVMVTAAAHACLAL
jgi:uncharacterized protein